MSGGTGFEHDPAHLVACLPNPVPFPFPSVSFSANRIPSPVKALLDFTLAPALRGLAVCLPDLVDATIVVSRGLWTRRLRRVVFRLRLWAPPH